jgi:predicted metalloprotease
MRWSTGSRESTNVEDRRGSGGRVATMGGAGAVIAAIIYLLSGGDIGGLVSQGGGGGSVAVTQEEKEQEQNVKMVLGSTERVWGELFRANGKTYEEPTLVLFKGRVQSACGTASSAVGPFYCPGDKQVYIDLEFFTELDRVFRAKGDFAQAYVIAHEIGHHVQKLLGISDRMRREEQMARGEAAKNQLSVKLELQADCLAGIWAHHAVKSGELTLEPGDLEEAIRAAEAIGDDALQKRSQGHVVPDSFTHGSSLQRIAWLRHGFETGDLRAADTFDDAVWNRVNPR